MLEDTAFCTPLQVTMNPNSEKTKSWKQDAESLEVINILSY